MTPNLFLWGYLTDYNGSCGSTLQSSITLPHCLSKKKKKKNHRKKICYCCFILCFFARGMTDLCLKLPARKDEHRYTKLPGALGMQTKFLGFQVFHWKVYHSRLIWISTGMSTVCISTPPCIQGCYRFDIG